MLDKKLSFHCTTVGHKFKGRGKGYPNTNVLVTYEGEGYPETNRQSGGNYTCLQEMLVSRGPKTPYLTSIYGLYTFVRKNLVFVMVTKTTNMDMYCAHLHQSTQNIH